MALTAKTPSTPRLNRLLAKCFSTAELNVQSADDLAVLASWRFNLVAMLKVIHLFHRDAL
jgi:hypothetical protein